MTSLSELNAKQARFASFQAGINAQHQLTGRADQTAAEIISYAELTHCQFPQYEGHWNGWQLVRIGCDIKTKAGQAFKAGDITIARYQRGLGFNPGTWTAYSIRNGIDTAIAYGVHPCEQN